MYSVRQLLIFLSLTIFALQSLADFESAALPFLEKYCLDCHDDGQDSKGGMDIGAATEDPENNGATWYRVMKSVHFHEMPPRKRKQQPSELERKQVNAWFRKQLGKTEDPGAPILRRLTRLEYNNSVRDLLGLQTDVFMFTERLPLNTEEFYQPHLEKMPQRLKVRVRELGQKYPVLLRQSGLPGDSKSAHGFSNYGKSLSVSPLLLEKYVSIAHEIAHHPELLQKAERFQEFFPNANYQPAPPPTSSKPPAVVTLQGKIAPNGNIDKEAKGNPFTLAQFQKSLASAFEEDRGGVYPAPGHSVIAGKGGLIRMAYGKSAGRMILANPNADIWTAAFATAQESSGDVLFTNKIKGKKEFFFGFQFDKETPGSGIAELGIVVLGRRNQTGSIELTSHYSNNTTETRKVQLATGGPADNTFVSFRAPKGEIIKKLAFNGSEFSGDYVLFDDLAFVTRDKPSTSQLVGIEPPVEEVTPEPPKTKTTANKELAKRPIQDRIKHLLYRAFKRPAQPAEVELYLGYYLSSLQKNPNEEHALRDTLRAILCAPQFIYRMEPKTETNSQVRQLDNFELASRLSYFLWSSLPDDELLKSASQSTPWSNEQVAAHVKRMLKGPRSRELSESFAFQWLQLNELFGSKPDPDRFRAYYAGPQKKYNMGGEMVAETLLHFQSVLIENRSVLELLDSPVAYLNPRLIKHYDLAAHFENELKQLRKTNRNGNMEDDNSLFLRVNLPDRNRGGLFTSGAPLTLTSLPLRTSPVYRGIWITETMFNRPPPPPPAMVEELGEDDEEFEKAGVTLRQKLAEHRENTACATCHNRIDPLGFAFENFDPIGRWRESYAKFPVDASGTLFANRSYNGPAEFKDALLTQKDDFVRAFAEHLLTYALGREINYYDNYALEKIAEEAAANDYSLQQIITSVAQSYPFRYTRN